MCRGCCSLLLKLQHPPCLMPPWYRGWCVFAIFVAERFADVAAAKVTDGAEDASRTSLAVTSLDALGLLQVTQPAAPGATLDPFLSSADPTLSTAVPSWENEKNEKRRAARGPEPDAASNFDTWGVPAWENKRGTAIGPRGPDDTERLPPWENKRGTAEGSNAERFPPWENMKGWAEGSNAETLPPWESMRGTAAGSREDERLLPRFAGSHWEWQESHQISRFAYYMDCARIMFMKHYGLCTAVIRRVESSRRLC
eukprot:Skav223719  [mRNA]  locus=scaffold2564:173903:174667:- [translate_table: standard]